MSETRPSMLRSCRVWLESRRDIPGDKLACMTALIGRAAERETVRVGRNAQCPACGGKIPMTSKFCMHCGQRVKITEIAEKSGQRHMPYSTAELEHAVELHRSGLTWAQQGGYTLLGKQVYEDKGGKRKEGMRMLWDYRYADCIFKDPAPDISVYAEYCIRRRKHVKRRMRQYGRK